MMGDKFEITLALLGIEPWRNGPGDEFRQQIADHAITLVSTGVISVDGIENNQVMITWNHEPSRWSYFHTIGILLSRFSEATLDVIVPGHRAL